MSFICSIRPHIFMLYLAETAKSHPYLSSLLLLGIWLHYNFQSLFQVCVAIYLASHQRCISGSAMSYFQLDLIT